MAKVGGDSGWGLIEGCVRSNWPEQKKLLAMTIGSDMNEHGASRGSISRNCENTWSHSVYAAFERLSRPALRGGGLPFQRVGGECAGFA